MADDTKLSKDKTPTWQQPVNPFRQGSYAPKFNPKTFSRAPQRFTVKTRPGAK